ncbi:MAG: galactokinase [Blastocatellia bacterium]
MANSDRTAGHTERQLIQSFMQSFATTPQVYQAPGRVNLIGEHTDYNDGFVMPAAIGFATRVGIAARTDRKLLLHSANFSEQVAYDLDQLPAQGRDHWSDYVAGVAAQLLRAGVPLSGANLLIDGDVPLNSGLSSSAAIEVAAGFALWALSGQRVDRTQLAQLCQRAENEFVGARVGIMDQFVSCHGQQNHALLLDCRSLDFRLLPLPEDVRLIICNTMVKHSIAGGEYNQRRAECEQGVQLLAEHLPGIQALRDVTEAEFQQYETSLPSPIRERCRHVITENARVQRAATALEQGDLAAFGQLMYASHDSLRDDYAVSCHELDVMVKLATAVEGVYGARMTGGGFGGCTINLVKAEHAETFPAIVAAEYQRQTGIQPEIYVCTAAAGASQIA